MNSNDDDIFSWLNIARFHYGMNSFLVDRWYEKTIELFETINFSCFQKCFVYSMFQVSSWNHWKFHSFYECEEYSCENNYFYDTRVVFNNITL